MWELVKTIAIGGLLNVGFIPNSTFLITVSHNGRGIFDCLNGERITRDYENVWEFFDDKTGEVIGFDVFTGFKIPTHGLFGDDNLTKTTKDGWKLESHENNILLISPNTSQSEIVGNTEVCELKAFGFSNNEKFFTIATSCDLKIYKNKND